MLPRINRLKNTKDIERVFKKGRGFKEGFLFLKLVKNGLSAARLAFIVSKKTASKASERNKIKRKMREAAKPVFSKIAGFDAVIVAQKGIGGKDLQEIKKIMEKLFKKANII